MTIAELNIQLDLQPENRIDILYGIAKKCNNGGYLFVDSNDGHCYLFDENGNEDDIKKLKRIERVFYYYKSLESIVIPDSVRSIGNWAFAYCKNLKSIVIPNSVENIGNFSFWNCENLKSLIFKRKTIDQVKEMKYYPFGIENESIIRCI